MEPRGPTLSLGEGATRLWLVVLSPLAVILIGHLSAQLFAAWWGPWAWVGTFLIYWSVALGYGLMYLSTHSLW